MLPVISLDRNGLIEHISSRKLHSYKKKMIARGIKWIITQKNIYNLERGEKDARNLSTAEEGEKNIWKDLNNTNYVYTL